MHKLKYFFLIFFTIFVASRESNSFAMNSNNGSVGSSFFAKVFNQDFKLKVVSWTAKALIVAIITVIIQSPDIAKLIMSWFSKKYANQIKLKNLMRINDSLKEQLSQLKLYCRDKKIIKQMEEAYLTSSIQVMELQKKYLEEYANSL